MNHLNVFGFKFVCLKPPLRICCPGSARSEVAMSQSFPGRSFLMQSLIVWFIDVARGLGSRFLLRCIRLLISRAQLLRWQAVRYRLRVPMAAPCRFGSAASRSLPACGSMCPRLLNGSDKCARKTHRSEQHTRPCTKKLSVRGLVFKKEEVWGGLVQGWESVCWGAEGIPPIEN